MIAVAPSILACDFARLADEVKRAEDAGADELHVDVMDGHFVPSITIGPLIVEAVRRSTSLPLNVHLMIQNPEKYAGAFIEAGADCILVHPECTGGPEKALEIVRGRGVKTGVAVNPETPFSEAREAARDVDFVLVMSVNPGWGGQSFMPEVLRKFTEARKVCGPGTAYGIDGGINRRTLLEAVEAGADFIIAGTALFGAADMRGEIALFRRLAEEALKRG